MSNTRVPPNICPTCDADLDAATFVEDERQRPSPGDLSVCAYCGEFLVFRDGMLLRKLTAAEEFQLPEETAAALHKVRRVLLMLQQKRDRKRAQKA